MNCFYQDHQNNRLGPFSAGEIHKRFLDGLVGTDTSIYIEDFDTRLKCKVFLDKYASAPNFAASDFKGKRPVSGIPRRTFKLTTFLWPFNALDRLTGMDERRILAVTVVGLFPLIIYTFFNQELEIGWSFWLTAFYFSVLWGVFFYNTFPAPKIKLSTSVFCFMGTGLVSLSILLLMYRLPLLDRLLQLARSDDLLLRWIGFVLAVGFPEELCKVLMLYVLSKRNVYYPPKTMAYYGMISGLGFGIYEGLDYQMGRNRLMAESPAEYLILNLVRLTTTPLLHAVWTGIAGFFLGFAYAYRQWRKRLVLAAISIPALLHGFYNAYGGTLASLGFALLSVLILSLYLAKNQSLETFLEASSHSDEPSSE